MGFALTDRAFTTGDAVIIRLRKYRGYLEYHGVIVGVRYRKGECEVMVEHYWQGKPANFRAWYSSEHVMKEGLR